MEVFVLVSCVGGLLYILFSCIVFSCGKPSLCGRCAVADCGL